MRNPTQRRRAQRRRAQRRAGLRDQRESDASRHASQVQNGPASSNAHLGPPHPGDEAAFSGANLLDKVLAFIPAAEPVVDPVLFADGVLLTWELAISFVVSLLGTVAATQLGSVVHERSTLQTGSKVKLRQVLRPVQA
ncbi:MAG: hypothetical protein ACYCXN_06975 [Acidimicrobiales bacterium]